MKIQLIGPMTGLPDWGYPAFHAAAESLRAQGHDVFNPAETFGGDTTLPRSHYMRAAIGALLNAEAVFLLPGFQDSQGAMTEFRVAMELGLEILNPAAVVLPEHDEPDD